MSVDVHSVEHATPEIAYELAKFRDNELIHNRFGDQIFVLRLTGIAYIRFNGKLGPTRKLRLGTIIYPFKKLYLSNEIQTGKVLTLSIGYGPLIQFQSDSPLVDRLESTVASGVRVYVGAVATQILAADPLRVGFVIQNVGDYDLFWGYSDAITVDTGQLLETGAMLDDWHYKGDLYGITAAGTTDVRKSEFT